LDTARLFVLTLLLVAPVLAQSSLPIGTASESHVDINSTADTARSISSAISMDSFTPAVVSPVSLPDAPVPQKAKPKNRIIDKKFVVVVAALGGAESLRFTTHKLVLDHEFDAGAPWVASVPANQHLVAKYAAIYAAEVIVAYELKKPHSWLPGDKVIRRLWWAYPAAMVPIHIKNGVRSIRTQAPSCPVAECGAQ
jgi:hypothetical protein